jgi:hypothetical protein
MSTSRTGSPFLVAKPPQWCPPGADSGRHQWLSLVILATQEAEIRRITVQSQAGQIVHETLSLKTHYKEGLVEWLKAQALSSSPSISKKKKKKKNPPKNLCSTFPELALNNLMGHFSPEIKSTLNILLEFKKTLQIQK